jgi:hypothetical protein
MNGNPSYYSNKKREENYSLQTECILVIISFNIKTIQKVTLK